VPDVPPAAKPVHVSLALSGSLAESVVLTRRR